MESNDFDIDLFFARKNLIYLISIFAAINFFLFSIKFTPTIWEKSVSLRSDSFNSLADFGYSILVLIGIYISYRPRDESHPHGHERFRPFISLLISISIILTGIIIVKDGIETIFYQKPVETSTLFAVVLIISISLKYLMYWYSGKKAKEKDNQILESISKDSKADVYASSSALVGIIGPYLGYSILDPIFGLLISTWIFKTGFGIAKRNIGYLTGSSPSKKDKQKIKKILERRGFKNYKIEPHYVGPKLSVSTEIEVTQELDLVEAHQLEEEIKNQIESLNEVATAYVHLEPVEEVTNND
ncbi:hypothetical protein C9439_01905 [archaeon SCG-AAA382B04]|nr:hypothetical protein C9439_01905 [archaeon SCG-AAA382B04]